MSGVLTGESPWEGGFQESEDQRSERQDQVEDDEAREQEEVDRLRAHEE